MEFDDILAEYPGADPLKTGGQKAAYLIDHPQFGISVLKVGNCADESDLERITREVETLRGIDSEYYPKNYRFDVIERDRFVLIEEYIEGAPLTNKITEYHEPSDALKLILEMAIGLSILWEKRIVHRDVKPDNTIVRPSGAPVIIDLGIARLLDRESITLNLQRGPLTRAYAAPEQIVYRKAGIDWRTDQFNLGILTMQLLLSGAHPFDPRVVGAGGSIPGNIIDGRWHAAPLADTQLAPAAGIVEKMLRVEQFQRYREPSQLIRDLETCLLEFGIQ